MSFYSSKWRLEDVRTEFQTKNIVKFLPSGWLSLTDWSRNSFMIRTVAIRLALGMW